MCTIDLVQACPWACLVHFPPWFWWINLITTTKNKKSPKNSAYKRNQIFRPMRIVAPTLFSRCFSSGDCRLWTSSHQGDRILMAVRDIFFFSGDCSLWTSSEFSSRRPSGDCRLWCRLWTSSAFLSWDHHKIAGYCTGYGPLQRSHQGDHQEIAGNGPLQSSDQGYSVLIDQWEAGIW